MQVVAGTDPAWFCTDSQTSEMPLFAQFVSATSMSWNDLANDQGVGDHGDTVPAATAQRRPRVGG